MAIYVSEHKDFQKYEEALKNYTGNAEEKINEVLFGFGGDLIEENIKSKLPVSGREWKGKKKSAKYSEPFIRGQANLSVVVKTKTADKIGTIILKIEGKLFLELCILTNSYVPRNANAAARA
jgi:hypothetical protein